MDIISANASCKSSRLPGGAEAVVPRVGWWSCSAGGGWLLYYTLIDR